MGNPRVPIAFFVAILLEVRLELFRSIYLLYLTKITKITACSISWKFFLWFMVILGEKYLNYYRTQRIDKNESKIII